MEEKLSTIPCTICGYSSRGLIYGARACEACKVFFKRTNTRGWDALKCRYDGHCEINIQTRHTCAYCRLVKCFANGMQKELLRGSRSKINQVNKRRKTIDDQTVPTRSNQSALIPTLSLLRADRSTLTTDQWILLSNLSHCYDDHAGFFLGEQYMSQQNILPHKLRFKTASIMPLYQMILQGAQSLYKNNRDFLSLSTDDRSILLSTTVAHTASISSNFILSKIGLMQYPAFYDVVEMMTSTTIVSIARRLSHRLDFDVMVMKLFLAILSFSTIRCTVYSNNTLKNLDDMPTIVHIQDRYIELTWRYLLYKYDHKQAVKCLSDLIRCIFVTNEALIASHPVPWFTTMMDSITEKTEKTLVLID